MLRNNKIESDFSKPAFSPVSDSDLSDVENMNGKGSSGFNRVNPALEQDWKGALAPFSLPKNFTNTAIELEKSKIQQYVWLLYQKYLMGSIELLQYDGLPDELDKYKLEYFLKTNGWIGMIKILNKWHVVPVVPAGQIQVGVQNIGYTPALVQINNIEALPVLKPFEGKNLIVDTQIFLIRDNLYLTSSLQLNRRILEDMEATLYQIEKNIKQSGTKVYLLTDTAQDNATSDFSRRNWEKLLNSDQTVHMLPTSVNYLGGLSDIGIKEPYISSELTDRTETLIHNFEFLKEMLKENLGFDVSMLSGKKERLLTDEVNTQSSLADDFLNHHINIRTCDFDRLNKLMGTNITVQSTAAIEEQEEQEQLMKQQQIENKGDSNEN